MLKFLTPEGEQGSQRDTHHRRMLKFLTSAGEQSSLRDVHRRRLLKFLTPAGEHSSLWDTHHRRNKFPVARCSAGEASSLRDEVANFVLLSIKDYIRISSASLLILRMEVLDEDVGNYII